MHQSLAFDPELIKKYDRVGPRYTSYPTAVQFQESFNNADYQQAIARSNQSDRLLSFMHTFRFAILPAFIVLAIKSRREIVLVPLLI